nr:uncharacterized protein LOC115258220 [Aedes albopictus]
MRKCGYGDGMGKASFNDKRKTLACSTVTVTKCQAALRTLQAFPFFRPTCLCKEPGIDPDCNYFRDFLFDHPCGFVSKKEKDPYPVDALPTCNHALSVCQQERKCIKLFEDFKLHCKVRENKCRMEDSYRTLLQTVKPPKPTNRTA